MRNAVIMMTANTTEDVVADSPPSAPSGRFGRRVLTDGATGPSQRKIAHITTVRACGVGPP